MSVALQLPAVIWRHRALVGAFVWRELKARYEGSAFGRVWPVVQPLILFAIYFLIFSRLLKIGFTDTLAPHGEAGEGWRTTFYLITGILPWTALAECLARGSGVVLENANLIKKIAFPSELLVVSQVVVFHVYFLIGFAILVVLEAVVNVGLPPEILWAPVLLIVQAAFVCGITLFLSAANVFVRDVAQAVPVIVTFWMFTTPVFYDLAAIRNAAADQVVNQQNRLEAGLSTQADLDAAHEAVASIERGMSAMGYNPMASILDLWRAMFSYGGPDGTLVFPVAKLVNVTIVSIVVLVLGYAYFARCKGRFADEV